MGYPQKEYDDSVVLRPEHDGVEAGFSTLQELDPPKLFSRFKEVNNMRAEMTRLDNSIGVYSEGGVTGLVGSYSKELQYVKTSGAVASEETFENAASMLEHRWNQHLSNLQSLSTADFYKVVETIKKVRTLLHASLGENVDPPLTGPCEDSIIEIAWDVAEFYFSVEINETNEIYWFLKTKSTGVLNEGEGDLDIQFESVINSLLKTK